MDYSSPPVFCPRHFFFAIPGTEKLLPQGLVFPFSLLEAAVSPPLGKGSDDISEVS